MLTQNHSERRNSQSKHHGNPSDRSGIVFKRILRKILLKVLRKACCHSRNFTYVTTPTDLPVQMQTGMGQTGGQ